MDNNKEIKEIKCWKTEDGKVFESEEQAIKWYNYLKFKMMIKGVVFVGSNSLGSYDNTREDVIYFIIKNSVSFKKIFMDYNVIDFVEFIREEIY